MSDEARIWTTVGSAGTLSATDLAKVTLKNAVVALGHDIAPPATAAPDPSIVIPPVTAVVRYNLTPVDGLFPPSTVDRFRYQLQLRYRGTVRARLVQVDLYSGEETDLLDAAFPAAPSFVVNSIAPDEDSSVMDFGNFAYYVEATLSASAIIVGNPAEIAIVKVYPTADFSG